VNSVESGTIVCRASYQIVETGDGSEHLDPFIILIQLIGIGMLYSQLGTVTLKTFITLSPGDLNSFSCECRKAPGVNQMEILILITKETQPFSTFPLQDPSPSPSTYRQ
jgi:hypothetical protein